MLDFLWNVIGWLIGWRPKSDPVPTTWAQRRTFEEFPFPPFQDFQRDYPSHHAAKMGVSFMDPWRPKLADWRQLKAALRAMPRPQYQLDADLVWSPYDKNCVGYAIRFVEACIKAGVPPQAVFVVTCMANGDQPHAVCGLVIEAGSTVGLMILDMNDYQPVGWRKRNLSGLFGFVARDYYLGG